MNGIVLISDDIPKDCINCPWCNYEYSFVERTKSYYCNIAKEGCEIDLNTESADFIESWVYSARPDWCPLRKIPEEMSTDIVEMVKEAEAQHVPYDWHSGWCFGWNACLHEILGDDTDE